MPRLGQSAPAPEVAACELPAFGGVVGNEREYIFIIAVAPAVVDAGEKRETVAPDSRTPP